MEIGERDTKMLNKREWAGSQAAFDAIAKLICGLDPDFLERHYPEGVLHNGGSPLCYLVEELSPDVAAGCGAVPLQVHRDGEVLGVVESEVFRSVIARLDASLSALARS